MSKTGCDEKEQEDADKKADSASETVTASRGVRFDSTLKMVLIPSRGEFKRAGMYEHLWWTSQDFLQFQASANSEIRMLASYEGIGAKLARFKLYQPGHDSIDGDEFRGLVGEAACTDSGSEASLPSTPSSSVVDLPALATKTTAKGVWRPSTSWQPPFCSSPGGFGGGSGAKTACAVGAVAPSSSAASAPPSQQTSVGVARALASAGQGQGRGKDASIGVVGAGEVEVAARAAEGARKSGALWGPSGDGDDTFGLFQQDDDEGEAESPITSRGAVSEEGQGEGEGEEQEQQQRPPSIDSDSGSTILTTGSSAGSSDDGEGLDDIIFPSAEAQAESLPPQGLQRKHQQPGMRKVSSLDCVKSALRAPLPEGLDEEAASTSPWSWNGKLKSALTGRKPAKAPLSPSSSSSPRGLHEEGFWRLCVSIDKPNGLDGERKSRFSNHRTYGHDEIMGGMGLLSLLGWVGAFVLVAYLVFDHGPGLSDGGPPLAKF